METENAQKETNEVLTTEARADGPATEGFRREYSNDGSVCVATFWLPREAAPDAESVAVAGTFNQWDEKSHPMKRLKSGDFALTVELEAGKKYAFRYLIDGTRWENAWSADEYEWSGYAGCENSVIVT